MTNHLQNKRNEEEKKNTPTFSTFVRYLTKAIAIAMISSNLHKGNARDSFHHDIFNE